MRVWIDQKACIGNGICEEVCPEVFAVVDGDIAYVRDGDRLLPEGEAGMLTVPAAFVARTIEAAEECPAACIYIEDD
jgi:ferredoxin